MLEITVPATEYYDEFRQEFVNTPETTLQLEHSLVSLSKWECKWHKPFLGETQKTNEEALDYIRCMTKNQHVNPLVYGAIPKSMFDEIDLYLEDQMTAAVFHDQEPKKASRELTTAETIYHWMFSLQIPLDCEKWHLNRLLSLIRFSSIKNGPDKKMSKKEIMRQNQAINAARRQQLKTRG